MEDVLRLSALQRLDDLVAEADRLWPAHPENIPKYEDWLHEAHELVGELPAHAVKLAELRAKALPSTEEQHEQRTEQSRWLFADARDQWWHNQLEKLVSGLEAFADPATGLVSRGTSAEHGWGLQKRLDSAQELRDGFVEDGEYGRAWTEALPAIRAAYPGLALTPQLGLVPLGPDPDSELWEFAHVQTGAPAERGPDGKLVLQEATGLVFVLLPGGTFRMGAQKSDSNAANYDPQGRPDERPVHAVTLSPFLLSKYEMTQAQWLRFTGLNPSNYVPTNEVFGGRKTTLLHPVEQVSWTACSESLARLSLVLPTEAQWEYAARAETTDVWWTGNEKETLTGAANLADSCCKRNGGSPSWVYEEWLDDGYVVHAPVGRFAANPFGLHDVIGNVNEWCRDQGDDYTNPVRRGDGEREVTESPYRVDRGGNFTAAAADARSAYRDANSPDAAGNVLGVRPARSITP
jgi:formylglycine-generating enzyme required for sulfatase activity